MNSTQRDLSLDFMKGVLIYLVVLGHVIAKYAEPGWAYTIIHTFHMPLFFFISGYLMVPSLKRPFKEFASRKFDRILLPALMWSLVFFLLKLPSHLDPLTKVIKSFMDIWFLYVLFYLFIVTYPMAKSKHPYLWYALAIVAGYLVYPYLLKVPSKHFGYIVEEFRIIRELPVFLMGLVYWEYKSKLKNSHKALLIAAAAIAYVFCFYHTIVLKGQPIGYLLSHQNYLARALAYQSGTILAFCVLKAAYSLIQSGHIAKAISFTGQNTLGIYAINGLFIFTVPAIIGIDYRFGLPLWIYALVMTAFLLGVTCLMRRIPIVRHLFLGEK